MSDHQLASLVGAGLRAGGQASRVLSHLMLIIRHPGGEEAKLRPEFQFHRYQFLILEESLTIWLTVGYSFLIVIKWSTS